MMAGGDDALKFRVKRNGIQLVRPSSPTPQGGVLYLSNLDDQKGLRFYTTAIQYFRSGEREKEKEKERDPAIVIREALAKALVHFYPFAGRLRPSSAGNDKLALHCTCDGVAFVEADANVSLQHFFTDNNYHILPPLLHLGELIDDFVESTVTGIIDSPPVFIQVTRLTCGGFIFAISVCHCVTDGFGAYLLVRAIGEMACGGGGGGDGGVNLSVPPVWERERLMPRNNPCVKYPHYEYQQQQQGRQEKGEELVCKSFVFGNKELALLKREAKMPRCNTFEVLAAYLWRSRTRALRIPDEQEVRLIFTVDIRGHLNPPLPLGYYGNAVSLTCTTTTPRDLLNRDFSFAVKLVRDAKEIVNEDYIRSAIDYMELYGRPALNGGVGSFILSDLTRIGMRETDYGWGRPLYGGPAHAGVEEPGVFMVAVVDTLGAPAIAVPLSLPSSAMQLFQSRHLHDFRNCSPTPPPPRASL